MRDSWKGKKTAAIYEHSILFYQNEILYKGTCRFVTFKRLFVSPMYCSPLYRVNEIFLF